MDDLMEDFLFRQELVENNRPYCPEKVLITAIIAAAFRDIVNPPRNYCKDTPVYYRTGKRAGQRKCDEKILAYESAVEFIDPNNEFFREYCLMIDLNPEYVAEKIWAKVAYIRENPHERKKYKELPSYEKAS